VIFPRAKWTMMCSMIRLPLAIVTVTQKAARVSPMISSVILLAR
jgi:hypothetical protein